MSRLIMLLMMLALAPISRAESYLNFLSEEVMPLHDKLFETNFVVSQDPPMCEKNKLIRGFFFSKYRAIYLCLENLLEDPRLGNIDGSGKDKDARLQLSRTLTHEAVHAAQSCPTGVPELIGVRTDLPPVIQRRIQFLLYSRYGHGVSAIEREAFEIQSRTDAVPLLTRLLAERCSALVPQPPDKLQVRKR